MSCFKCDRSAHFEVNLRVIDGGSSFTMPVCVDCWTAFANAQMVKLLRTRKREKRGATKHI